MSLANLSAAYERMRTALEELAFARGEFEGFRHIFYCRWCHYSREYVEKYGHQGECPLVSAAHSASGSTND
jgi:hypothetical protein